MDYKVRTYLVDDEEGAIRNLSQLIADYLPMLEVVGTAGNVTDAVEGIGRLRPELVLLDVQLGQGTGFDVLDQTGISRL